MPEGTSINLDIKELYRLACPKCKKKFEALVRQQLAKQSLDDAVKRVLKGD